MNKHSTFRWGLILACAVLLSPMVVQAQETDPDIPRRVKPVQTDFSKEEFMTRRAEGAALKRGIDKDSTADPKQRISAISVMQAQEAAVAAMPPSLRRNILTTAWTEIGPNPIPNAQVVVGPQTTGSGRTIAIAVHPTNPNLVYVGTAQGGLYRSTDGGAVWTPMMDNALSLAIGTIAIAPSQPDTIFVGTGEPNFSADSFFGVGIYRIDNASTASPIITGPIGGAEFTGRAVGRIAVHPTDANIIFASSTSGVGGIGGTANNVLASRGLFRSTDALSAVPTFTRLTGLNANANASVHDFVIDPLNPNLLIANEVAGGGLGGIYVSTDALAASPTFTQRVVFNSASTSLLTAEFAIHRTATSGPNPTIYAATGNPLSGSTTVANGRVLRSIDGGTTWTTQISNGFCGSQCFYDIAIAVDPVDPATVYLGGSPNLVFGRSTNSGVTFTANAATANGLHADSHAITVAPSLPSTIYFGSDGGIYKSIDSGNTWVSLNNSTFKATQFMSLAVHPVDPNFSIGGTQDNGTNFYKPDGTWNRVDFGDGGYAVIDQNATDSTNVRMYHTYFNQTNAMGYARVTNIASASEGAWSFFGCGFGGSTPNGMTCTATATLFYAPMEPGPGNPNTLYFGSDVLYRSADGGTTVTKVSQDPITSGAAISAIGVSPQNDNVRIVGQNTGGLFGTTTGASVLTNLDSGNQVPNNFIARAVIDPNNANTAYVTLSAFGVVSVWRTSDLSSANPTWTPRPGTGANVLPQVPVSAFLVDPAASTNLYAGTDIGVYVSTDSGANWTPFGTGLPRVAVFDMAKTSGGLIRIATHGRGMWEVPAIGAVLTPFLVPTTATLVSESFLPANGVIDPGETVSFAFGVQNTGNASTVSDVGTLQASGGVTAPGAAQNYGVVVNGGAPVSRNFTFTAAPALSCGANFTATIAHLDGATNLGSLNYTLPTGVPGATTTTSYTTPPVVIPDAVTAGVNIPLTVSGVAGAISDLNFRLDAGAGLCDNTLGNVNASVTHPFMSDLVFKLTSPSGTTVNLIANRGGAGVNFCTITLDDDGGFPAASTISGAGAAAGSFKPESPLAAFKGQDANGTWTLNVADTGATDVGTLNRFSLIIRGSTCAQPPATVTNVTSSAANATYGSGATIPVVVTFSAPVNVTGTPQLALNSGGVATYASGSGSSSLTFNYVVAVGQTSADLDYSSTSALTGTFDYAVLTLPAPGAAGSLGANKDIVINALSDLTIAKTHVGNFAQGQLGAQFTITVTNSTANGPTTGSITVTDTLPAGLTFVSGTGTAWTCSAAGQLVTCVNASTPIATNATSVITLNVNVAANAAASMTNTAVVACTCTESNTSNNTSNIDAITVTQLPDLTISKAHLGSSFTQGQQGAQYTLSVTNVGAAATTGTVTVTDTLPAGLTFVSGTGTGWACSATGQLVTCTDAATPIGVSATSVITLNVNVAGTAATSLSNSAAVACSCTESNTTNNTSNTDVVTVNLAPDLTLTKTHTGSFVQGQIGATYSITVNNIGPGAKAAAAGVTVTDTAPSGLAITAMSGTGWTCTTLPTCTRSDVLANSASYPPITVTVTVATNASTPQINSAAVSTTAIEQDTTNNTATDSTVILVPPDLTVTKTHVGNFSQGQTGVTYMVTVSNSGLGSKLASDVVTVTDTPPSGLTITAMSGAGWTCTTLPTCTRSDLLIAGASYPPITVTVSVATNATSPKVNSVTVSTTALESNGSNNTATDSTVILVPPDLTISKSHSGNFLQGQAGVTYTSVVTNSGPGDKLAGTLVTVTDTPPPSLTITAMSGTGWTCTTLPTCTRSDLLAAGFSYPSITITASVAGSAASPLVNSITVSTTAFESSTTNNTATDSATVVTAPDLTVNKSHVGNFSLGQIGAKYTVVVTNSGAGEKAAGLLVSLVDTVPGGLTITAISGAGWTCASLTTCTRSDALASGVSYPPVIVTVNVAPAATSPQVNTVAVTTAATESNASNNLGTDSTIIDAGIPGALTVAKVGSGSGTVVSQDGGIACGATCTATYLFGSNIVLTATPSAGSVFTGWLGPCAGTGTCTIPITGATTVPATFALSTIGNRILDIDANGAYLPESDGVLVLRYLFGLRGSALTTGALGTGAGRTGEPQMSAYLLDILPLLDVDGNGKVDALTDGLMIMRKLLGMTGSAITANALGAGPTRPTADIEAYIQTLKPP